MSVEIIQHGFPIAIYLSKLTFEDVHWLLYLLHDGRPLAECQRLRVWMCEQIGTERARRDNNADGASIPVGPFRPTLPTEEWNLSELLAAQRGLTKAIATMPSTGEKAKLLLIGVSLVILDELDARVE